jgi:flagellar biosynthesis anti-sigma factor FlgM
MDIRDVPSIRPSAPQPARSSRAAAASSGEAHAADGQDHVQVSARGRAWQAARLAALGLPEVREERVAELRRRLVAGELVPDTGGIARALLEQQVL